MSSATSVALGQHTPSAFTTFLPNPSPSMLSTTRSVTPHEPTLVLPISNIRERSSSPVSSPEPEMYIPFYSQPRRVLPLDPIYALPPPDLGVRFVYKRDEPVIEEGTSLPESDVQEDTPHHPSTPLGDPSIPLPRIYFVDSAIQFVPPFCHDYLERDPLVKGVPRNYRAWARAGRPKLQIEGLEKVDAKGDFLAMGLTYPQGSDDDDSGDEKEKGKKGRRKKKLTSKAQIMPIERPRRMVRKIVEAESLTVTLAQKKRLPEKKPEEKALPSLSLKPNPVEAPKVEPVTNVIDDMDEDAVGETDSEAELELAYPSLTVLSTLSSSASAPLPTLAPQLLLSPALRVQTESAPKRKRPDNILPSVLPTKRARTSQRLTLRRQRDSTQPAHPSSRKSASPTPASVQPALVGTSVRGPAASPQATEGKVVSQSSRAIRRPTAASAAASSSIPASASIPPAQRTRPPPPPRQPPRESSLISTSAVPIPATIISGPAQLPPSRPGHRISLPTSVTRQVVQFRTFPPGVTMISGYSGFYRRFPLITQFEKDDQLGVHILNGDIQPKKPLGNWNTPRDVRDLYTPRYTKGSGGKKIALCPICYEEPNRGGEGRQEWNHTKTSQHNYHMQYYHGISATRFQPFSPPIVHRTVPVARPQSNEKAEILQGKCHNCKLWIPLEGCKVGELKVKELFWWKHAAACHKDSSLQGEEDIFIEDDAYRRLLEYENSQRNG